MWPNDSSVLMYSSSSDFCSVEDGCTISFANSMMAVCARSCLVESSADSDGLRVGFVARRGRFVSPNDFEDLAKLWHHVHAWMTCLW